MKADRLRKEKKSIFKRGESDCYSGGYDQKYSLSTGEAENATATREKREKKRDKSARSDK